MEKFNQVDLDILKKLKQRGYYPKYIFDVGSAGGHWSGNVIPMFPDTEYYLFEPLADIDKKYIASNKRLLDKYQWHLKCLALGEEDKEINFYKHDFAHSSTGITLNSNDSFEIIKRPCMRLDTFINKYKLEAPSLVKMDTQGCELDIIKGLGKYLEEVEILIIETWLSRGYRPNTPLIHELMNYLAKYGIYMYEVAGDYRPETGDLISQDFFFVNKKSDIARGYRF